MQWISADELLLLSGSSRLVLFVRWLYNLVVYSSLHLLKWKKNILGCQVILIGTCFLSANCFNKLNNLTREEKNPWCPSEDIPVIQNSPQDQQTDENHLFRCGHSWQFKQTMSDPWRLNKNFSLGRGTRVSKMVQI